MHVDDWKKHPVVVLAALVLAIVSGALNIKLSTDPTARPDPFTGTEGRELWSALDELRERYYQHSHEAPPKWVKDKLQHLESDTHKNTQDIKEHQKEAEDWKRRIIVLENKVDK